MKIDRADFMRRLEALAPEMTNVMRSFGAHEPDWEPLRKVMPSKWCGGFMFMGYHKGIRTYKHGMTRHSLNVDERGDTYRFVEASESYQPIPRHQAITEVFEGLKEMGYERTDDYTDEVRAERHRRLAEAGWKVMTIDPSKDEVPKFEEG